MESQAHTTTHHARPQQERCPRCTGNLFLSTDDDNLELGCLQCGRSYSVNQRLPQVAGKVRERVAA